MKLPRRVNAVIDAIQARVLRPPHLFEAMPWGCHGLIIAALCTPAVLGDFLLAVAFMNSSNEL
jgi:hypothetical protein